MPQPPHYPRRDTARRDAARLDAARLDAALASCPDAPVCVGFSGGLDSSVPLHALADLPQVRARGLRAVHVDHGLHAHSPRWAAHCAAVCAARAVPLQVVAVAVERTAAGGLEAAARQARHAAFARVLGAGEVLALAHHRDDQVETLLLRLMRGSGSAALAGMAPLRPLGEALLWRPLLELPRALLLEAAQQRGLRWIDDPANADLRHDRALLRHDLLPRLRARWAGADTALARSARLLGEDAERLRRLDAQLLDAARSADGSTLSVQALRRLGPAEQRAVLRAWLRSLALPLPPAAVIDRFRDAMLDPPADAAPRLRWAGAELRRYRDALHAMAPLQEPERGWELRWDARAPLQLPHPFGRLWIEGECAHPLPPLWVRPRRGGERLLLPGRRHHDTLKALLQRSGVPPWQRARLPLLAEGPHGAAAAAVLAAGDLLVSAALSHRLGAARLRWQAHATGAARATD